MVVLAWDSVLAGAADIHDGHNVVLHEFAHQLDQQTGAVDGAPILPRRSMYARGRACSGASTRSWCATRRSIARSSIDYGATNPAEFFAVVTETFFEKPEQLRERHPELYEQMKLFYRQDPEAARR